MPDQEIKKRLKSRIFERGQVWFWDDPIFGRKSKDSNFQIGEAAYRYSRYMVIVQTPETITTRSILAVPCSTGNHTPNDVPIPMNHIYHNQISYAKVSSIMPVHPKLLSRYHCTLPDEIMKQIDAEIIKLIAPYITSIFSDGDIKEWFGIDMNAQHITPNDIDGDPYFNGWVQTFVKDRIMITGDFNDRVTARELKNAYDVYCVNSKTIPITNDIYRFIYTIVNIFNELGILSVSNWSSLGYEVTKFTEFIGIKLKDDSLNIPLTITKTATPEPAKVIPITSPESGRNNWQDKNHVKKFITSYENDGIEVCAKRFNLGQNTAKRYYTKFIAEGFTALPKDTKLPTAKDSPKSVSKISNMIDDYLHSIKAYESVKDDIKLTETEFYAFTQSACYFSLLEFLGIEMRNNNFFIPTLTAHTPNLDTWRFFDIVYHDRRVSMEKSPIFMMATGRLNYENFGIGRGWLSMLIKRLNKIAPNEQVISSIVKLISEQFCAYN